MSGGLGHRLRLIREQLGETQRGMSDRFDLGVNTWQVYERMDRLPKDEALIELIKLGVSIDWLITGQGEMSQGGPPRPGNGAIDIPLLTQISTAVLQLYGIDTGDGQGMPRPGELIGRIYSRLAVMSDDGERRGALRYALDQLSEDLRLRRGAGTDGVAGRAMADGMLDGGKLDGG